MLSNELQDSCTVRCLFIVFDLFLTEEAPVDSVYTRIKIVKRQESKAKSECEVVIRRNVQAASCDAGEVVSECLHRIQ